MQSHQTTFLVTPETVAEGVQAYQLNFGGAHLLRSEWANRAIRSWILHRRRKIHVTLAGLFLLLCHCNLILLVFFNLNRIQCEMRNQSIADNLAWKHVLNGVSQFSKQ